MLSWYWIALIVLIVGIGIALFFEESREWLQERVIYFLNFEWMSDVKDFFTGLFENFGKTQYYCKQCGEGYRSKVLYQRHLNKHKREEGIK